MDSIKEARKRAGLTQAKMSELFEIPKRTIEEWDRGVRKCPRWAEILIIEKLEKIAADKEKEGGKAYDSFRVSAVFDDGKTIDNDIIEETGTEAINAELESAKEWFADQSPANYLISYYLDGECIGNEIR